MLGALGVQPQDEVLYRLLLGLPSASCRQLADAAGLTVTQTSEILTRLAEFGLVTPLSTGDFTAAPPAMALGSLISEQRAALRTAELALATFAEAHRAAAAGRSIAEVIEVVTGPDAIRQRFLQVQHAARDQVRTFVTAHSVAAQPGETTAEHAGVARGVRYRVIVERAMLAEPGVLDETVISLRGGSVVRVADTLPIKLVLADTDLALVALTTTHEGEPGAVLLQHSGLLVALDALFELVWQRSHPLELDQWDGPGEVVESAAQDGPTDLDRKILTLLLSGLSDQAVAGQLDISLRTLQRRLRLLMDLAGVDTRMKLGWYAARHDWA